MVVGFTITCAISAYHHYHCEFEPRSWQGVLDTTLCDQVCQWLVKGQWFSPGTPVSSTNKTDCNDITEILLKVVLNTTNQTKPMALIQSGELNSIQIFFSCVYLIQSGEPTVYRYFSLVCTWYNQESQQYTDIFLLCVLDKEKNICILLALLIVSSTHKRKISVYCWLSWLYQVHTREKYLYTVGSPDCIKYTQEKNICILLALLIVSSTHKRKISVYCWLSWLYQVHTREKYLYTVGSPDCIKYTQEKNICILLALLIVSSTHKRNISVYCWLSWLYQVHTREKYLYTVGSPDCIKYTQEKNICILLALLIVSSTHKRKISVYCWLSWLYQVHTREKYLYTVGSPDCIKYTQEKNICILLALLIVSSTHKRKISVYC